MIENNQRIPEGDINSMFIERWSPRAFDADYEISDKELVNLMDAARWSPSSYNEQPWRFFVAKRGDENYEEFLKLLVDQNRTWAKNASAIGFIFSRKNFAKNGKENSCAEFDCGSAWMAMTMQANMDGLYTHGMAGIKHEKAYQKLKVDSSDYKLICGFAVGKKGSKEILPKDLQDQEKLRDRKDVDDIYFHGNFSRFN